MTQPMTNNEPTLEDAFFAGFMASREGLNGEYPFAFNEEMAREKLHIQDKFEEFLNEH